MTAQKPVLQFFEKVPPYAALGAAKLADFDLKPDGCLGKDVPSPVLKLPSGEDVVGTPSILRHIALGSESGNKLLGADAEEADQVNQWLDKCPTMLVSGSGLQPACEALNEALAAQTCLAGNTLSTADLCAWGQLQATSQWNKVRKSDKLSHLNRWYDFCCNDPVLKEVVEQSKKGGRSAPKGGAPDKADGAAVHGKGGGDTGSFDIGLPDAVEGKVVTRFPPEPSGYLHIGHAKAALLNQYFADMYKGKMLMRFDDTNPSKENDEFVDNIMSDVKSLGLRHEKLTYTSDYFDKMIDLATRLIKAGHLYADDTPVEKMRQERMDGIESERRSRSVEENLRVFDEMLAGSEEGLLNCLRFKLDMQEPNKALRDPVAFRCNLTPHWRTGTKYKAYPTYDFACPFVDSYEGVTHALRSSEYKDREAQFYWVLRLQQEVWPGLPHVHMWDFSRLSFVNTVLSKRKLKWFVETGRVDGWDDPRFPTVQGIFRRGLQLEALKEFIISQGASKNVTYQEWDKIWTINKKIIDPECPRHTAVDKENAVPLELLNGPDSPEVMSVPRHKKFPAAGMKATTKTKNLLLDQSDAQASVEGEEVTLMDWGNCFIREVKEDESGKVVSLKGELNPKGDVKKTKRKLTWLAQLGDDLVDLQLVDFGYLITKKKLEEDDKFEDFVNEHSRSETSALGDPNMRTLQKGDIIQLERKGYFIVDVPLVRPGKPMVLFTIPDGRSKNVSATGTVVRN